MIGKLLSLGLVLSALSSAAAAQECDPDSAKATIDSKYATRIAAADSMCEGATLTIEMLEYAKKAYRACLRGKSLNDVIVELDKAIGQTRQTKIDVGCS